MKKLIFAVILFLNFNLYGQQFGGLNNTTGPIYRTGRVGLGIWTPISPTATLEIKEIQGNISALPTAPNRQNVLLKLSNKYNGSAGATNEPTILFDNGEATNPSTTPYCAGWALSAAVASNANALPACFRIGFYTGGLNSNYNEHFRILDNGKTIIGNPLSFTATNAFAGNYKLFVADGILTEKIKLAIKTTSNWSDFVFDKSYKMKSLFEVEKFIEKNKHLPDVPSAKEMVDKGLDVAAMDAKLLQKIEELTLYVIEINKNIEQIKKENNQLKKEIEILKLTK
jgi:hypothetical protein